MKGTQLLLVLALFALPGATSFAAVTPLLSNSTSKTDASHLYLAFDPPWGGAGVGIADFDGDGILDVAMPRGALGGVSVYRGTGGFALEDASAAFGSTINYGTEKALAVADYDNDGDPDLLVTYWNVAPRLFRNDDGAFTILVADAGLTGPTQRAMDAAWCDLDADGWLDLVIARHTTSGTEGAYLYQGAPDGVLVDVTATAAGFSTDTPGAMLSVACVDADADGDPDLLFTHDNATTGGPPSRYLVNESSDGVLAFTEGPSPFPDADLRHIAFADFDLDGRLDLFATTTGADILLATTCEGPVDIAPAVGATDPRSAWGALVGDFNLDGRPDLYVAHDDTSTSADNGLLVNQEDGTFLELAFASAAGGGSNFKSHALASADFDLDGDEDILFVNQGAAVQLLENDGAFYGNWLRVRLQGTLSNRDGIGARVEVVRPSGALDQRVLRSTTGFLATSDLSLTFGLGGAELATRVTVRWPSGVVQTLTGVPANQALTIVEAAEGSAPPLGAERCGDGVDNDCDGITDPGLDEPCSAGVGACLADGLTVCAPDEVSTVCGATPLPAAPDDLCGNGVDDDCDGATDEGEGEPCELGTGACLASGLTLCVDGALACDATPLPPADELCADAIDNDCDGDTDEDPETPCAAGVGICVSVGLRRCGPAGEFCDAPAVDPWPFEACADGLDNDCDGETDEGLGAPCSAGVGACAASGSTVCGADGVSIVCDAPIGLPQPEVCGNDIDDNCDGATDEGAGAPCSVGVGACAATGTIVCKSQALICDATAGQPSPEHYCDAIDNDCDGATDEGAGEPCTLGVGACKAQGLWTCSADGLSLVCDAQLGAPTDEVCGNGVDDDCDGATDEGEGDPCAVGAGACAAEGVMTCTDGALACSATAGEPSDEHCADGLDNDCDGLTDEAPDDSALQAPCEVGTGACAASGLTACGDDGFSQVCDAPALAPAPADLCGNAIDDDCDGLTDNGFELLGQPCVSGTGHCVEVGAWACTDDLLTLRCEITEQPGAIPERCGDYIDNDCDGETDEGFPDAGSACTTDASSPGLLECDPSIGVLVCVATPDPEPGPEPGPEAEPDPEPRTDARPTPTPDDGCSAACHTPAPPWLAALALILWLHRRRRAAISKP